MPTWTGLILDKAGLAKKLVMASFEPKEKAAEMAPVEKLPLRRFNPTLRKFLEVAMPTDLQRLRRHQANMEKHVACGAWKELNIEQINASRTVQQLNATMRELENTRGKIMESDLDAFDQRVNPVKQQVVEAVQSFGDLQQCLEAKVRHTDTLKNDEGTDIVVENSSSHASSCPPSPPAAATSSADTSQQFQVQETINEEEHMASASWDELRQGLICLQDVISQFSCLVQEQQGKVDTISANVESAQHNVRSAILHLGQASKLKAAVLPIAGAIVGGVLGGPIGLMAGFKLAGVATAVGGSFLGYQGARYVKNKHHDKVDNQLTYLSSSDADATEMQRLKSD